MQINNLFLYFICLSITQSIAMAEEKESAIKKTDEWVASIDVAIGDNPATLGLLAETRYRHIYRRDISPLWDGLYSQGGFQLSVTPAFGRIGAHIEWLPIAMFQLRLQYDHYHFFGQHGSLLTYGSGNEAFGDDEIKGRKGEEITGTGDRILFQPILQMKFGPYIVRDRIDYAAYSFSGDGPFYHEWEYDTLLTTNDHLFVNQLMLYYELIPKSDGEHLLFGPFHEYVRASNAKLVRTRVGANLYYAPAVKCLGFNQPRIWAQAGWNLKDRNRDDEIFFVIGVGADFSL